MKNADQYASEMIGSLAMQLIACKAMIDILADENNKLKEALANQGVKDGI
jgi:hypothetical protein